MKTTRTFLLSFILLTLSFNLFVQPSLAATKKKTVSSTTTTTNAFFHKRRLVHQKAPIPKTPKPTLADIKKAKQQAIAGKGYVKKLKGWLAVAKKRK
jgi:hypothetical protein